MSNIIQYALGDETNTLLKELTTEEFDSLFNDDQYAAKLYAAKTTEDIDKICNEFKFIRLLEGK